MRYKKKLHSQQHNKFCCVFLWHVRKLTLESEELLLLEMEDGDGDCIGLETYELLVLVGGVVGVALEK